MTRRVARSPVRDALSIAFAASVLAALFVATARSGLWWPALLGILGPDVALAFGGGRDLARGQLHPRAVPLYNALHMYWAPLGLTAFASLGLLPVWLLVTGLAWTAHVAVDRAVGYGLRTATGFQRD